VLARGEPPPAAVAPVDNQDGAAPPEHTSVWELWSDPPARQDATFELLQTLRVIQNHPEGICARDIGNEMGIDWRRVPALTRSLLDAGVIEQVGQEFYPTVKATSP